MDGFVIQIRQLWGGIEPTKELSEVQKKESGRPTTGQGDALQVAPSRYFTMGMCLSETLNERQRALKGVARAWKSVAQKMPCEKVLDRASSPLTIYGSASTPSPR